VRPISAWNVWIVMSKKYILFQVQEQTCRHNH
jgi:hypothetical protein